MAKRAREAEDEEAWAAEEASALLAGSMESTTEKKIRALDRVLEAVDPSDNNYTANQALVAGDAAFYLTDLLQDSICAVSARAADAMALICSHSAGVRARQRVGGLIALEASSGRAALNPCRTPFVEAGALRALTALRLGSPHEGCREAAEGALSALCDLHKEAQLDYLEALVAALEGGDIEALGLLDGLLDGMECGSEEVAGQLDRVLPPLLQLLRATAQPSGTQSLTLLCTLCERRQDLIPELRAAGAVRLAAAHLLQGGEVAQDTAAHALWLLVKDKQKEFLGREGAAEELGCAPVHLAARLGKLVQTAEVEEALRESENDAASVDGGSYDEPPPSADICYAEDAQALLRALAAQHPEVQQLIAEKEVPLSRGRSCCVM